VILFIYFHLRPHQSDICMQIWMVGRKKIVIRIIFPVRIEFALGAFKLQFNLSVCLWINIFFSCWSG